MKLCAIPACVLMGLLGCGQEDSPWTDASDLANPDQGQEECLPPDESTYSVRRDPVTGAPFHWEQPMVLEVAMADADVIALDSSSLWAAVEDGMGLWDLDDCIRLELGSLGTGSSDDFGYHPQNETQQTLIWWVKNRDDWMQRHSQTAIAVTSIFTEPATGRILDADIELNAFESLDWTVDERDPEADIQSVVAHEFGHLLGLDHSRDPSAVMAPEWSPGWLRRTLTAGDVQGLCTLYQCPELLW